MKVFEGVKDGGLLVEIKFPGFHSNYIAIAEIESQLCVVPKRGERSPGLRHASCCLRHKVLQLLMALSIDS